MQKQLDVSLNMWYMKHLEVVLRNEAKEEGRDFCQMIQGRCIMMNVSESLYQNGLRLVATQAQYKRFKKL